MRAQRPAYGTQARRQSEAPTLAHARRSVASVWEEVAARLSRDPELQPLTVLEWLQERYPEQYPDRLLRTLQRRIKDWPELFAGDEVLATAILDRLLHRSHVLNIKGRSYRLRDLEQAASLQQ